MNEEKAEGGKQEAADSSQPADALHPSPCGPHASVRVFCAVELPAEVRARVEAYASALRAAVREARASWPRAENLHLTLKFLGEIKPERVAWLSEAALKAAQQSRPFNLKISGTGSFPPRGTPRVLWLGVEDSAGELVRLQKNLEQECALAGFKREERSFSPHLTLARVRSPQGARQLARLHREMGFEAIEFFVNELVVMRSELGSGGSRYTPLSRHALRRNAGK